MKIVHFQENAEVFEFFCFAMHMEMNFYTKLNVKQNTFRLLLQHFFLLEQIRKIVPHSLLWKLQHLLFYDKIEVF